MLTNKVALITGSTSGIGLATAKVFAKQGIHLILHGLLPQDEGQQLAAELTEAYQINVIFDNADLRDEDAINRFIDSAITTMGSIDILINNAGIQHTAAVTDFPSNKWHDIIAINLSACFHTIQKVLPTMQANQWGRIINVASVHGLVASVNKAAYCAAKHGVIGLTKVVALENAEQGITANAICPGWVDTPLISEQIAQIAQQQDIEIEQARYQLITAKQPLPDMSTPSQIGEFILFLCGDNARGITGASLPIDGAWTAQ